MLIVSEGSKTEPNYFREIRAAHRLHTASVEVQPSDLGTAPIQVDHAPRHYSKMVTATRTSSSARLRGSMLYLTAMTMAAYFDALNLAASLDGKLKNDISSPLSFRRLPRCLVLSYGCCCTSRTSSPHCTETL